MAKKAGVRIISFSYLVLGGGLKSYYYLVDNKEIRKIPGLCGNKYYVTQASYSINKFRAVEIDYIIDSVIRN